jgi:hypothetical protein
MQVSFLAGHTCGVSERQLHRRCTAGIGYGPKMLQSEPWTVAYEGKEPAEAEYPASPASRAHSFKTLVAAGTRTGPWFRVSATFWRRWLGPDGACHLPSP